MVRPPALRRPRSGLPSLVVTGTGAGLVLTALLFLDWFDYLDPTTDPGSPGPAAGTPINRYDTYRYSTYFRMPFILDAYVSWLCWLLLLAVVLAAMASSIRGEYSNRWRVVGALLGIGGAAATYFAGTNAFATDRQTHLRYLDNAHFSDARIGPKIALAGFLICALGAALGPLTARPASGERTWPIPDRAARIRHGASLAVLAAGCGLLLLAFGHTSWYETHRYDADPEITFGDLVSTGGYGGFGPSIPRLSLAFFPSLGWVLVVAASVVVLFANGRTALTPMLRTAGLLIGLAGVVLLYVALSELFAVTYNPVATNSERSVFLGARSGLWFAFTGYLLCAVAAAIVPPASASAADRTRAVAPVASDTIGQ